MCSAKFEPQVWQNFLNATCYSYALNIFTDCRYYVGDIYPGKRVNEECSDSEFIEILMKEVEYLGFKIKEDTLFSEIKNGETKLYIVRTLERGYYHFFRLDNDGVWSHKRPNELPNRIGYDGRIITNPILAAEPGYDKGFCFTISKKL